MPKPYRLSLCLLLFASTAVLRGQRPPYAPTAVEGATWIIFNAGGADDHYALTIHGDTVINDTTYKRVYHRTYDPEGADLNRAGPPYRVGPLGEMYALLRDDTLSRQLYGRVPADLVAFGAPLSDDTLVYDYGVGVGEALRGAFVYDTLLVDALESRYLYGQLRNYQGFDGLGRKPKYRRPPRGHSLLRRRHGRMSAGAIDFGAQTNYRAIAALPYRSARSGKF